MRSYHKTTFVFALTAILIFGAGFSVSGQSIEWKNTGPGGVTVTSVLQDVSDSTSIFLTTNRSGFFRSTDGGESWQRKDTGLPISRINNVVQDSENPEILFLGTERGVYRSFDYGNNWSLSSGGEIDTTSSFLLAINPIVSSWVFAASQGNGVYRSSNSGEFWTTASAGLPPLNYVDITVDPNLSDRVYLSSTQSGVFRGLNGDELTWAQKNDSLTNTNLRSFSATPQVTGLIFTGTTSGGFFRSTNLGDQWQEVGDGLPGIDISAISFLDTDPMTTLAGTDGQGIYSSSDNGDTFSQFSSFLFHHNVSCLFSAGSNRVYAGMEKDGLFISSDGGTSWNLSNQGLPGGNISALALSTGSPQYLYAGLNEGENDLLVSSDRGQSWELRQTGLPNFSAVNDFWLSPTGGAAYACTDSGVFLSTNQGVSWSPRNSGLAVITSRIVGTPVDEDLLFCLASGVFKSTDGGASWDSTHTGVGGSPLSIILSPTGPDTLYTGTKPIGPADGGVFKSTDGGGSWSAVNVGLNENETVFSLEMSPGDPSTIFAATGSGIFRTSNAGQDWSARNNGLPEGFAGSDILIDLLNPQRIFTSSTDYGVYSSTDSGESWASLNDGLDTLRVLRLAQNPIAPDTIFAATAGMGLYLMDLSPTAIEAEPGSSFLPRTMALGQNYPNPFNPMTTISVRVDEHTENPGGIEKVTLRIYDLRGRLVKTLAEGYLPPGEYRFTWDGKTGNGLRVSSGTYFAVLEKGKETVRRKMTLIK